MGCSRTRWVSTIAVAVSLVATSCTGSPLRDAGGAEVASPAIDGAAVPIPLPDPAETASETTAGLTTEPSRGTIISTPPPGDGPTAALIDTDGQLAIVEAGVTSGAWFKFDAFPSPDRSTAVLTLDRAASGLTERPVQWVSLPHGETTGSHNIATDLELTATSLDGTFAGFTSLAGEPIDDAIAGTRRTSRIQVLSRDDGVVFEQELEGNFMPEAFSGRLTADGIPALVFLLEYFPADLPRFYRVRVLDTDTGEVSLPLNLRDKQQQIDERMAGFSRSQVVAEDHGLLFTLYRGTIDGTPDGEPYAFVHTLDFADGVWCLEVDPRLDLDRLPGSLAVGGDRLYVGSANGMVGSYPIPSITDPNLSPSMDWVATFSGSGDEAPVLAADDGGVWIGPDDPVSRLVRIDDSGERGDPHGLPGSGTSALAYDPVGTLYAVADDWATFEAIARPDWLGEIAHLVVD